MSALTALLLLFIIVVNGKNIVGYIESIRFKITTYINRLNDNDNPNSRP